MDPLADSAEATVTDVVLELPTRILLRFVALIDIIL